MTVEKKNFLLTEVECDVTRNGNCNGKCVGMLHILSVQYFLNGICFLSFNNKQRVRVLKKKLMSVTEVSILRGFSLCEYIKKQTEDLNVKSVF